MFQPYNAETAPVKDRIAWVLCQIIDDDAPLHWTRYRGAAECIAGNHKLMADLQAVSGPSAEAGRLKAQVDALAPALRDIGKYTGEGPNTTPWQEIVRDIAQKARDALAAVGL